jgi:hypothetical protein
MKREKMKANSHQNAKVAMEKFVNKTLKESDREYPTLKRNFGSLGVQIWTNSLEVL